MGWEAVFFLDDDVVLTRNRLYKAMDLLYQGNVDIVGFSARFFPDHSVAAHAQWLANGPIDTFIGSGTMAVRTSGPILPSDKHAVAREIMALLQQQSKGRACTIVIHGSVNTSWQDLERYRRDIVRILASYRQSTTLLISLIYRETVEETTALFKRRALAVVRYGCWLWNHRQKIAISWREL